MILYDYDILTDDDFINSFTTNQIKKVRNIDISNMHSDFQYHKRLVSSLFHLFVIS